MKEELTYPFESPIFFQYWEKWLLYKKEEHKFRYKSIISIQTALDKLFKISKGNEEVAIEIIEESISNGWKGFFELKNKTNNGDAKPNEKFIGRMSEDTVKRNLQGW